MAGHDEARRPAPDRRWWAVGATCIADGGYVVEAPTRRQAIAAVRHTILANETVLRGSERQALAWMRSAVEFWIVGGPFDEQAAHDWELGWNLAEAVCRTRRGQSTELVTPDAPLYDRAHAVFWLGEQMTAAIEDSVDARYPGARPYNWAAAGADTSPMESGT